LPSAASIRRLCAAISEAFLDAVGASAGPLYATAFTRAGEAVSGQRDLDAGGLVAWIEAMAEGIRERGGAAEGDKTMLDAWAPAAAAARAELASGGSLRDCLAAAAQAAAEGRDRLSLTHKSRPWATSALIGVSRP
jgi:dihydroxyacetone kinase